MSANLSREVIRTQVGAFASGAGTLEELRRSLTPVLVEPSFPGPEEDAALITRLSLLFEDDSISQDDHKDNATIIAAALASAFPSGRILELLPLLLARRRICAAVTNVTSGKISRTSFLSLIAESRLSAHVKRWLSEVQSRDIDLLCRALSTEDVGAVHGLIYR